MLYNCFISGAFTAPRTRSRAIVTSQLPIQNDRPWQRWTIYLPPLYSPAGISDVRVPPSSLTCISAHYIGNESIIPTHTRYVCSQPILYVCVPRICTYVLRLRLYRVSHTRRPNLNPTTQFSLKLFAMDKSMYNIILIL